MFAPTRRKALILLASIGVPQFAFSEGLGAGERAVVAAYVDRLVELAKPASKDLVLASMTTSFAGHQQGVPTLAELQADIPETTPGTAQAFLGVNAAPLNLDLPGDVVAHWSHVRVVDQSMLSRFFEQPGPTDGWKRFYEEFPNASSLIQFSRVGIDDQAGQALFWMTVSSGMLSGASYLVLMEHRDGAWRPFKEKMLGIS